MWLFCVYSRFLSFGCLARGWIYPPYHVPPRRGGRHLGQGAMYTTSTKHNGGHSAGCGVRLVLVLTSLRHYRSGACHRLDALLAFGQVLGYGGYVLPLRPCPWLLDFAARKTALLCGFCGLNASVRTSTLRRMPNVPLACGVAVGIAVLVCICGVGCVMQRDAFCMFSGRATRGGGSHTRG